MLEIENKAMDKAFKLHAGQKDDEGREYFTHLVQVVCILHAIGADYETLSAAWLHDSIEDTDYTPTELLNDFGKEIHDLVMEVTHEGKADNYGYYFPRLQSKRGIMIKFADRLSNLSRMRSWCEDRQLHYLRKSKFWNSLPPQTCEGK